MNTAKKGGMTREQAAELYDSLKKTMEARHGKSGLKELMNKEKEKRRTPTPAQAADEIEMAKPSLENLKLLSGSRRGQGSKTAILMIIMVAGLKLLTSVLEYSGILEASPAFANMAQTPAPIYKERFSKEEVQILTKLDSRRVELEERGRKLGERERDLDRRDKEFAAKLTELRELTKKLNGHRERNESKKRAQLEQLANVYGAMNPQEAAKLIEQLDVTITLSLLERMPEKRIGQILALMNPEKALMVTKLLSGKKEE